MKWAVGMRPGHRAQLVAKWKEVCKKTTASHLRRWDLASVETWLEELGLGGFAARSAHEGYDVLDTILSPSFEEAYIHEWAAVVGMGPGQSVKLVVMWREAWCQVNHPVPRSTSDPGPTPLLALPPPIVSPPPERSVAPPKPTRPTRPFRAITPPPRKPITHPSTFAPPPSKTIAPKGQSHRLHLRGSDTSHTQVDRRGMRGGQRVDRREADLLLSVAGGAQRTKRPRNESEEGIPPPAKVRKVSPLPKRPAFSDEDPTSWDLPERVVSRDMVDLGIGGGRRWESLIDEVGCRYPKETP
jgi:hypothetical protein